MKSTNNLRKKDDKELAKLLAEKQDSLRTFRFGAQGSRAKNVKEAKNLKKDIARIKTLSRERELNAS